MTFSQRHHQHDHIVDLLPAHLNGSLDRAAHDQVRAHLESCGACRAELAEWEAIAAATRRYADALPMPAVQGFDAVWDAISSGKREASPAHSEERLTFTSKERKTMYAIPAAPPMARRHMWRPITMGRRPLWTGAIVLLVFALGIVAYSNWPTGPDEPVRLPAAQIAGTPGPAECPNTPNGLDRMALTGAPSIPSAITLPPAPYEGRPGITADNLPTGGEPANSETVAEIERTVQALVACMNVGDTAGLSSLVTDDYWRRTNEAGIPINAESPRSLVPLVGPAEGPTSVPIVERTQVLPDGRVGATVRPGFDAPSYIFDYYVFTNIDGRWLIDEAVHVTEMLTVEITVTDDGFTPAEVRVPPVPAEIVLCNEGTQTHSLVVPDLLVRIEAAPGEAGTSNLKAPTGSYAFESDMPGDDAAGFSGTLIIEGESIATPVASPPIASSRDVLGVPVASTTITMRPPEAYEPNRVSILANRDVEITIVNDVTPPIDNDPNLTLTEEGAQGLPANFTIDVLGISVDLEPGERQTITVNAPPGVYAFHSIIPGHTEVGMSGTLHIVDPGTPAP